MGKPAQRSDRTGDGRRKVSEPRDYFSRRVQYQMLALVFSLLLVLVLMQEAAKPRNWEWLWTLGGASSQTPAGGDSENRGPAPSLPANRAAAHNDTAALDPADADRIDTRLPESPDNTETWTPGTIVSVPPLPSRSAEAVAVSGYLPGIAPERLQMIRDDTFFRRDEITVWYELLEVLSGLEPAAWAELPAERVGFVQLFRQPTVYRGKLVEVAGTVRRAHYLQDGGDRPGVRGYWQCWLRPEGTDQVVVVYSLQMPDGFPTGMEISESVTFKGVFYKRWAYRAGDGIRTAPLILAKTGAWQPGATVPHRGWPELPQIVAGVVGAAIFALVVAWWATRQGTGRVARSWLAALLSATAVAALSSATHAAAEPRDALARRVTAGPREVLGAFQIGESELHFFRDGEPLHADNEPTLVRILNRMPQFSRAQVQRWRSWETDWHQLSAFPQLYRGAFCRVAGQTISVERMSVPASLRQRYTFDVYYRVELRADDAGILATVYCREVPTAWVPAMETGQTIAERVAIDGMFLKTGPPVVPTHPEMDAGGDYSESLVFVAHQVGWYPDGRPGTLNTEPDHVLLAALGFDVAQLAHLEDGTRLTREERECFYQGLDALGRATPRQLQQHARRGIAISELLSQPAALRGQFLTLSGKARRAIKIVVTDEDIRERFGWDTYYEVEVFVDSDAAVRFTAPAASAGDVRTGARDEGAAAEAKTIRGTYPVVFCLRELPAEMPQGESIHQRVVVTGAFWKQWAYRSEFVSGGETAAEVLQSSPLLIGRTLDCVSDEDARLGGGNWFAGLALGALCVAILGSLLLFWQDDRRRRRQRSGDAHG